MIREKIETDRYTLYLADCMEVLPMLEPGSFQALVTDPPYSSGGAFRGDRMQKTVAKYIQTESIATCRIEFGGDNRDQRSFGVWCALWLSAAHSAASPGSVVCCFSDWRQLPTITDALQAGGWVWRNIATWWKPGVRMQRGRFSSSAEYVVYGSRGSIGIGDGELSPQNVFACQPVPGEDKDHVAEKPEDVLQWVLGVTPPAITVIDPFMGSGTTGVVCMGMDRKFIGVEIDQRSFQIAAERIAKAAETPPLYAIAEKEEQGGLQFTE